MCFLCLTVQCNFNRSNLETCLYEAWNIRHATSAPTYNTWHYVVVVALKCISCTAAPVVKCKHLSLVVVIHSEVKIFKIFKSTPFKIWRGRLSAFFHTTLAPVPSFPYSFFPPLLAPLKPTKTSGELCKLHCRCRSKERSPIRESIRQLLSTPKTHLVINYGLANSVMIDQNDNTLLSINITEVMIKNLGTNNIDPSVPLYNLVGRWNTPSAPKIVFDSHPTRLFFTFWVPFAGYQCINGYCSRWQVLPPNLSAVPIGYFRLRRLRSV